MNPYTRVQRLVAQRRGEGRAALLPLLAALIVVPLAQPLLAQVEGAAAVEALTTRLAWLVAGWMVLHAYDLIVRGADRPILDLHPIQPVALLEALVGRALLGRLWLPLGVALATSPLALTEGPAVWGGLVAVVLSAYVGGVGAGFAVSLGGVWAAYSPRLAGLLALLAGSAPKMQTSLIYAPGAGLFVVGAATALAASGVRAALLGWSAGWLWLGMPAALGVAGLVLARRLAPAWYVRATALLTEIDTAHAGAVSAEEARAVYLDWLARGWPELLRALRQGWRARRLWVTGAWGLGGIGALGAWGEAGPTTAMTWGSAAVLLYGLLPGRLAAGDPPWLDLALGVRPAEVAAARAAASAAYGLGVVLPIGLALLLRHGLASALPVVGGLGGALILGVGLGAGLSSRLGSRAQVAYAPLGLILLVLTWRGVSP